jgi:hypothetical protein
MLRAGALLATPLDDAPEAPNRAIPSAPQKQMPGIGRYRFIGLSSSA